MKNVTITLREDVAKWAKVWAAEHDTSVSNMLGELLKKHMEMEVGYHQAMNRFLKRGKPHQLKRKGQGYPSRAELYDRSVR